jgi:hypothetical protein
MKMQRTTNSFEWEQSSVATGHFTFKFPFHTNYLPLNFNVQIDTVWGQNLRMAGFCEYGTYTVSIQAENIFSRYLSNFHERIFI